MLAVLECVLYIHLLDATKAAHRPLHPLPPLPRQVMLSEQRGLAGSNAVPNASWPCTDWQLQQRLKGFSRFTASVPSRGHNNKVHQRPSPHLAPNPLVPGI